MQKIRLKDKNFLKKMFELVIWWYIYSNKDNLLKIIFG